MWHSNTDREFMYDYSRSVDEDARRAIARSWKNPKTDAYISRQSEYYVQHWNGYLYSTARRWVSEWRSYYYGKFDFDGMAQAIHEMRNDL